MRVSPVIYAAELEQAAAATAVIEQADTTPPGRACPWPHDALQAAVDAYGAAGFDLPFEYQNDVYAVECGRGAPFYLFH